MIKLAPDARYVYAALVEAVHDGDTFTALVDLGFQVHVRTSIRLFGCNAIELRDPGGRETQLNLSSLILGRTLIMRTVKADKYGGRYDAQCALPDGTDLVGLLVREGWAMAWDGKGVKPTPAWPRVPPTPTPVPTPTLP